MLTSDAAAFLRFLHARREDELEWVIKVTTMVKDQRAQGLTLSIEEATKLVPLTSPVSTAREGQENKYEPAMTDTDLMPFGKHKGVPLEDVPADYLGWLYQDGCSNIALKNYIWNSRNAINEEMKFKDKLITKYK